MAKETIYIEADEEITAIIDKVTSAKDKVVAVVLPKRTAVLQSTVNMKLLNKAAKDAKKSLVLISSDPAIESVAAIAAVHVAKSLQSKPAIPKRKKISSETTIKSDDLESESGDAPAADNESAAETADEPIKLDNTADDPSDSAPGATKSKKSSIKFKVPDFSSFRLRMGLAISAVIILVVGWFFGFVVLPKATVTLNTDTKKVNVSINFVADIELQETNTEDLLLPATKEEVTKKDSVTVKATGEKDAGTKASGTITLTNCREGASGVTIPAGTGFSADGKTYSTTAAVDLGPAVIIGICRSADFPDFGAVKDVSVVANEAGESYNIDAQTHQSPTNGVTAFGSKMTGGTTKLVKVVSKEDIKSATDQLAGSATAEAVQELKKTLEEKQVLPLEETLQSSEAITKNSKAVDAEAEKVTVSRTVTYSMVGVDAVELSQLLEAEVRKQLEGDKQNIRSDGLDSAVFRLLAGQSDKKQTLQLQTVATIGPTFDEEAIRNEIVGKKRGDIEDLLEARDGVKSVEIEYSPLWVTTMPKSAEKITIVINEVE